MLITSTDDIPGRNIIEVKGMVRANGVVKMRNNFGSFIDIERDYRESEEQSCDFAVKRMVEQAGRWGRTQQLALDSQPRGDTWTGTPCRRHSRTARRWS